MIFNKTIIPLVLVGYEMIIANRWLSITSCPTLARGIILNYFRYRCCKFIYYIRTTQNGLSFLDFVEKPIVLCLMVPGATISGLASIRGRGIISGTVQIFISLTVGDRLTGDLDMGLPKTSGIPMHSRTIETRDIRVLGDEGIPGF